MKQLFLAAGVIAALTFTSCKKDDVKPLPENPGAAKQLKKITKTEDGIVTVYNLTYDASDRLVSYKSTNNAESIILAYDAAGNLTGIEQKEDNAFKNVYTYTYENNVPVSGTFKSWELTAGEPDALIEDDVLHYTVTNNQVSTITVDMTQSEIEVTFSLTYSNGNLTKVVSDGPFTSATSFTYGNKKPVFPKVTNWVLDQAGFSLQFAAANELLSTSYDLPGNDGDFDIHTTYTYDSNGYVLTGTDGTAQLVFEY